VRRLPAEVCGARGGRCGRRRRCGRSRPAPCAEAADYLEIPLEHVDACLNYYADYKDEIDAWIEQVRTIAERERHRQQVITELLTDTPT